MSAIGGVLVAAVMIPAVGSVGEVTKSALNKFQSLSTQALGEVPQRSEILDRYGHHIAYVYNVDASYYYGPTNIKSLKAQGIDRQPVTFDQIAPVMRNAVIAIEDSRYYQHGAIDFKGTMRALVNDLEHKPVQGGSTIAQQYVKNVLVLSASDSAQQENATSETLSRKLHELRLAIAVEHQMSRNQILAGYLNDAYFGNGAVGIEVAAQTYFHVTAAQLTLPQAALLAGLVENPTAYNPIANAKTAMERRNTVLARMEQVGMISEATSRATQKEPVDLHASVQPNGCTSPSARSAAFFCTYVEQAFLRDSALGKTPADRAKLLATGGLRIYTTLDPHDQRAANQAVNYWVPPRGPSNPGHNADTEAVVQPGTGDIKAIAVDRPYGTGRGQTTIDLAVDTPYGGGAGVQSGSSNKLFVLVTALEQGVPFGYTETVQNHAAISGYTDCSGQDTGGAYTLVNASKADAGTFSLYTGTTLSINTFYAQLEKKVGLCNVAQTAVALGDHRVDGSSIMRGEGKPGSRNYQYPADQTPSFTLGSINVSPLTMAAAYATVASRGMFCHPVALTKITTGTGKTLPVPTAGCHRAIPAAIADAANYILQGVLINGTAGGEGIGRPAAGKTGTGDGPHYVDFAGYTPSLVSYTSVFYPPEPITHPLVGEQACYRGGCPGTMFGAQAPAQTWQMTFEHSILGPVVGFVPPDPTSQLFSLGNGQTVKQKPKPGGRPTPGGGGGGGGGGGPNPNPTNSHCPTFPFCQGH
jgi:membrane peptidoglycan carboxypeptidase